MTVRDLLARASSAELTEWQAYERIAGPLGGARGDWQAANIASTVYGMLRDPKRSSKPRLRDFLIEWGRNNCATSDEDMERLARQLADTYGGWQEVNPDGDD